ncbi:MAG: hypothetical protein H7Y04_03935, partial [Verrucomicrobia bacterium]|nr:hypothetical protein [Cytophagales bacterium]
MAKILFFAIIGLVFGLSACTSITKTIRGVEINALRDKQLYEFSEVLQAEGYAERIFIFGNLRR